MWRVVAVRGFITRGGVCVCTPYSHKYSRNDDSTSNSLLFVVDVIMLLSSYRYVVHYVCTRCLSCSAL